MNQEQQVDQAQTLMRELLSLFKFHEPSTSEKIMNKLQNLNPIKISRFNGKGHLILIAINLLVHLLKHKQIISPWNFKKFFTLSVKNLKEGRLINLLTHAFSHVSFPHLLTNILLFYGSSEKISSRFGAQRMFMIYIFGAIASAVFLFIQQRKNRDTSLFNGSNGGYAALAGYAALMSQHAQIQVFGFSIPVWLNSLLAVLCCINQNDRENKHSGGLEFSGFLSGILFNIAQSNFFPQQQSIRRKEILISVI